MPAKNKPKRLDRARSWRVARRKREQFNLAKGIKRSRKKRPKHKGTKVESKPVKKIVRRASKEE